MTLDKQNNNESKLDSVPKKSKMLSENSNELNLTNAKSRLTVTSPKKIKNTKKNLFDINEKEVNDSE